MAAITCGPAVACREDAPTGPARAATVPNVPLVPLPFGEPSFDASSRADAGPTGPTEISVAVVVDPGVSADRWTIKPTIDGVFDPNNTTYFFDRDHEVTYRAPDDELDAPFSVEIEGTTVLSDGSEYKIGRRVLTTRFVPHEHKLAYLYVDTTCAYSEHSTSCPNMYEWCWDGKCRPEEVAPFDLPPYAPDWRTRPPNPCGGDTSELQLGEGLETFGERKDGDTFTLECGPQGGHHLWLAFRVAGLDQRSPTVTASAPATDAGPAILTSYPLQRLNAPATPGSSYCEQTGVLFQLDYDGRPITGYLGRPLDITVEIRDRNGVKATVTRRAQIAQKLSTTSCVAP